MLLLIVLLVYYHVTYAIKAFVKLDLWHLAYSSNVIKSWKRGAD